MRRIPLRSRKYPGLVALVDDEDYEMLSRYRWNPQTVKSKRVNFYAITVVAADTGSGRTIVRMHKLLTSYGRVDHVDGNGLNNQKHNLREVTDSQNAANQVKRTGTSSRFKGVSWSQSSQKWAAYICKDGRHGQPRNRNLGTFTVEEDAARAYDEAAVEAFGEFARLNFPC